MELYSIECLEKKDMSLTVSIVGAGLGGLMLARVLHVRGVASVVYEAEASATARGQGGMLDIHDFNGQLALKDAGLFEIFQTLIHPGGQQHRVLATNGTVLVDHADDGSGGRPEVPRGELRRILLESLPEATVRWGHKVTSVTALGGGRHRLAFANGLTTTTDLVVGADGAWSKIRPLLSDEKPAYTGTTFIETYLFDADNLHAASAEAVGGGSLFAVAPGKGIMGHREPAGVLHTYVSLNKPREWIEDIDFSDPLMALGRVAEEFAGWSPALTALITDGETDPVARPLYTLPVDHRWDRVAGVTLVGDAAHLMIPSGEGANLAMFDGAELAKVVASYPDDLEQALALYEEALFTRSAAAALEAKETIEMLFGDDSPRTLVAMFSGLGAAG
jgi:2-polyprenyl-6-methoxyphenol hydroxylase-like FAD-dependent oxidoreductase